MLLREFAADERATSVPANLLMDPSRHRHEDEVPVLLPSTGFRHRRQKCRECGSEVSLHRRACPHCGFPTSQQQGRWGDVIVMTLVLAVVVAAAWELGLLGSLPSLRSAIESGLHTVSPGSGRDSADNRP